MAHGRDKPGKEKRKPKKEKSVIVKPTAANDVIDHVQSHGRPGEPPSR